MGLVISVGVEVSAVGLLACSFVFTDSGRGSPLPGSLPSIAGTLCVIASGAMRRRQLTGWWHTPLLHTVLSHHKVVYIGKLSYPLYLWHWPVLVLMHSSVSLHSWRNIVAAHLGITPPRFGTLSWF
eukprot:5445703-Prymnesium_polylepis.2